MMSERMTTRCFVLLVNRGRGKLYRRARYGALTGEIKRFLFWTLLRFGIGNDVHPIELDISTTLKKRRSIPLFIVNEQTGVAIAPNLIEKGDQDLKASLNILTKQSFWLALAERLKLGKLEIAVFLLGGMGLYAMIQYIVGIFVR